MKMIVTFLIMFSVNVLYCPSLHAGESTADVISEAKALFKEADQLQGAWVTTGKLIKSAEKALKKGQDNKALKLANKAKMEAKLSIAQAEEQLKNWSEPAYIERP